MSRLVHRSTVLAVVTALSLAAAQAAPPQVLSVAPQAAAPGTPVVIHGTGFGLRGGGRVLIGGVPVWTARWTDSRIVAYVPDALPAGAQPVEVVAAGQAGAGPQLAVQPRPQPQAAAGTVAWRFEVLADVISHRADTGADGTVYVNDSAGFLYALTPQGALKWIDDSGGVGSQGPTVVGADGTVYFGAAAPAAIHAVNPDGSRKWLYPAPRSQGPIAGPAVGPDGNVYAVFDQPGAIGAVSLTPAGALRWNTLANPRVAEVGQVGRELVFGAGNVHFSCTDYGDVYAFNTARGTQRFRVNTGSAGQVDADGGTVYVPTEPTVRLNAYSKTGQLQWSFFGGGGSVTNDLSAPAVGRDGSIYINRNLGQLVALTPAPSVRWTVDSLLAQGPVPGPAVSPNDDLVLIGGQRTFGEPGLLRAFATVNGAPLFQIALPLESDGGCPVPYARPRFTPAGTRAYVPAVQLCVTPQQPRAWIDAIDVVGP